MFSKLFVTTLCLFNTEMIKLQRDLLRIYRTVRHILSQNFYCCFTLVLSFIFITCVSRPLIHKFPPENYDIDAETESDNENQVAKVDLGTKEGYLLKGPEIGSESIFSNLASKSFKKRYCSMVREADGAYILEVYKDEKKTDTKLTIVMDFCSDVVKVSYKAEFYDTVRQIMKTFIYILPKNSTN